MTDLIDTTEMYLRTILELEEEGIVPMRARIAERLEHSGPTVSQTVARMEKHGLLTVEPDRHLELTDEGRQKAVEVMRKHRLAERLLSDIIGLDLEYVHEEACRWEHVMSDKVEKRILQMLNEPNVLPLRQRHSRSGRAGHCEREERRAHRADVSGRSRFGPRGPFHDFPFPPSPFRPTLSC